MIKIKLISNWYSILFQDEFLIFILPTSCVFLQRNLWIRGKHWPLNILYVTSSLWKLSGLTKVAIQFCIYKMLR